MKYLFLLIFLVTYTRFLMDMLEEGDYYGVIEYADQVNFGIDTSFIIAKSHMALGDNKKAIHYFHRSTQSILKLLLFSQCYYAEGK